MPSPASSTRRRCAFEGGNPIIKDFGKAELAGGWGQFNVAGLFQGSWSDANPAGGGYEVRLDVPAAAGCPRGDRRLPVTDTQGAPCSCG